MNMPYLFYHAARTPPGLFRAHARDRPVTTIERRRFPPHASLMTRYPRDVRPFKHGAISQAADLPLFEGFKRFA